MSKTLFAGLLAGALLVPQAAVSNDAFQLPPIPYAETIPWLAGGTQRTTPVYLGVLLDPNPLAVATASFESTPAPSRALLSTQLTRDAIVSAQ